MYLGVFWCDLSENGLSFVLNLGCIIVCKTTKIITSKKKFHNEHFQIPPSRIPGPQSLGKKEICREGWDLGFIYPNETSPSLGEKASFQ